MTRIYQPSDTNPPMFQPRNPDTGTNVVFHVLRPEMPALEDDKLRFIADAVSRRLDSDDPTLN